MPITALTAVADAAADLATAIRNMLDDQVQPEPPGDIADRILAACGIPADPEPTTEPKPDAPIDFDSLGLGAVIRGSFRDERLVFVKAWPEFMSAWAIIRRLGSFVSSSQIADVEVLHPGITIGGDDA